MTVVICVYLSLWSLLSGQMPDFLPDVMQISSTPDPKEIEAIYEKAF